MSYVNFTLDTKEEGMVFHRNRLWIVAALFCVFLFSGPAWGASDKVDLNAATEQELAELDGIGAAKAKAIVEYRKQHGAFKRPEDLMNVSGIGPKTFQSNKDRITIGGARPSVSEGGKKEMKSSAGTGTDKKTSVSGAGTSTKKTAEGTAATQGSSTTRKDAKKQ